jgi:diguanylate cyclase (GGDEF)-like protein
MPKPLRILIVEDSENDAELLLRALHQAGYEPVHERVESAQALRAALAGQDWDLIISDYSLPGFNGLEALKLVRDHGGDIPFIIVSGSIGEDIAVTAMKTGAHDYIMKGNIARLIPAIERELKDADVRRERWRAEERSRYLAHTDPVTDLPNRVRFHEQVQQAVATSVREGQPMALLLMDLERFKEVNDTLGHKHGDQLLRQVGQRLRDALFSPDTVARLGGDEFGILLPRLASPDDVAIVCKKILAVFDEPIVIVDIPVAVETSIGVALAPEHADNADNLMQQADMAMYRAKKSGGGYVVYAPEYNPYNPQRLALMAELRDAIEHNQLLLHFQPMVEIKTRRILGNEALVRWQHPRHGLLAPDKFIGAAEHTGLIAPLSRWVLIDALSHCQGARRQGIHLRVSVNLSARSLHDPHLPEMVENALNTTGAEPGQLTLEITESAIMLDPKRAEETLARLSRMGIRLSIDDFGTGYTSLASIARLPVNEIKIDRSFVAGMLTNKSDATIVRSVIELAHNLDMTVVAEGVETQETFDALAALGCDEAQGYFISRPQPCEVLKKWMPTSSWGPGCAS